jgi:hypothetical protein
MPSRRGEVRPPFSVRSHVELLSRIPYHGPQLVELMVVASEPSLPGERLRQMKQSVMNLRLPKHVVIANEGTIGSSRGKGCCKSPFLAQRQEQSGQDCVF